MKVLSFTRGRSRTARRRSDLPQPGSRGEHTLQERYGTQERADQVLQQTGHRPSDAEDDGVHRAHGDGVHRHE